jgi:SAM-dependent methyltransferase
MRAVIDLMDRLDERDGFPARIYVAERLTPAYRVLAAHYPGLVGSEYLDPALTSGTEVEHGPEALHVRHEDLTRLSFEDATFDRVVTMEVFEHVPAYRAALHACRRVLRPHGSLIFTVPFFPEQRTTEVRATVANDGTIIHHLPAEYHGDPVRVEAGALCFQHFGWDLLDDLRAVGFATATANLYWGPWQGHLGRPYFVFEARVAETGSA